MMDGEQIAKEAFIQHLRGKAGVPEFAVESVTALRIARGYLVYVGQHPEFYAHAHVDHIKVDGQLWKADVRIYQIQAPFKKSKGFAGAFL